MATRRSNSRGRMQASSKTSGNSRPTASAMTRRTTGAMTRSTAPNPSRGAKKKATRAMTSTTRSATRTATRTTGAAQAKKVKSERLDNVRALPVRPIRPTTNTRPTQSGSGKNKGRNANRTNVTMLSRGGQVADVHAFMDFAEALRREYGAERVTVMSRERVIMVKGPFAERFSFFICCQPEGFDDNCRDQFAGCHVVFNTECASNRDQECVPACFKEHFKTRAKTRGASLQGVRGYAQITSQKNVRTTRGMRRVG